ncbi:MAG: capsular polysaccharide biosynthesis protein, partial [Pseudomonadota bacterium]
MLSTANPQDPSTAHLSGFGLRPLVYVVGMWRWKEASFAHFLTDKDGERPDIIYFDETCGVDQVAKAIALEPPTTIIFWGMKEPEGLAQLAAEQGIPTQRVEDGFLRSIGLTSTKSAPLSLCFDSRGMYFDPRQESDLTHLLLTHDFDPGMIDRAEAGMRRLATLGVSKYNHAAPYDVTPLYGPKDKTRILVLGQVEDDQSIEFGVGEPFESNQLVRLAADENPDAQIIYKPHPDVLAQARPAQSN